MQFSVNGAMLVHVRKYSLSKQDQIPVSNDVNINKRP